ncbi:CAAX prenyl protease 2 isoform X2 [Pygocentrus nattereri]|uniref:CAAX prenyl protease 2 isoform X2 n=1 Tax=Pygocentrus nattereri TaxID=42514 RepID=UPI0008148E76|nr:CAAX prenyl protease 2 isoform X2 [Pygocentrus nattereri]
MLDDVPLQIQPVLSVTDNVVFEAFEGKCYLSILSCLLLACLYVGSLYIWRGSLPRDHPSTIKKRFISVLFASAVSPLIVWAWMQAVEVRVLFLGPLIQMAMDSPKGLVHEVKSGFSLKNVTDCLRDLCWLRNHVVAPLTEELVFRASMLPILAPCTGPTAAIFIAPLFFGVAHFHHVIEQLRFGHDSVLDILVCAGKMSCSKCEYVCLLSILPGMSELSVMFFCFSVFQFSYTSVFGAYTAFIFTRTGHLVGPVLCHSFCNWMGFPALGLALQHPQRPVLMLSYELGLLLFILLLFPLTDPLLFGMTPICSLILEPRAACS